MTIVNFIRIQEETEKAIKIIIRESGYDLDKFQAIHQKTIWIPKSVCSNLTAKSVDVQDWFFDKNIASDIYAAFMKSLANS